MKAFTRIFTQDRLLVFLLVLAAVLRFCCYSSFSFANDELSALFRTLPANFSALIRDGVYVDFHPAGIQVFLWFWVGWFGDAEAVVRLPFVLMGIASVYLFYRIAASWFGKTAALFFTAAIALMQYPVLYSQLARPYAPGLFFSLLMIFFWQKIIFPANTSKKTTALSWGLFTASTALCAYTHYFSGFMAILVAISGLFFITKSKLKAYLLSLGAAALLFLPHVPITLYQFSKGGVGEWLGKPGNDWIWKHFFVLMNDSWFYFILFFFLLGISLLVQRKNLKINKFHYLCLAWSILPFLLGFYYSRFINPVLQHSVLLFSSLFFLLFLFSFWGDYWKKLSIVLLLLFIVLGVIDTVLFQRFYRQQHFGEFKDIALTIDEWNKQYGVDQVTQVLVANNPYYVNLYLNRLGVQYDYAQTDNRGEQDLLALCNIVQQCKTNYFILAWTKSAPDEMESIIRSKYPCLLKKKNYQGLSQISLYTRVTGQGLPCLQDSVLFYARNSFETNDLWGTPAQYANTSFYTDGQKGIYMDQGLEFGPTYEFPLSRLKGNLNCMIRASIDAKMPADSSDTQLVIDLFTPDGISYGWASANFKHFIPKGKAGRVYFSYPLPSRAREEDYVKVYIWNHGLKPVELDNFRIQVIDNQQ